MPSTTITPNMSLIEPVPGVETGPQYANDLNASLTLIDQHDHSPGHGVLISPTGLNINVDLPLNNNNLTLVRSIRFDVQGAPINLVTDLSCLYSVTESGSNGDLWYNDASGNQIQITKTGAVLATISALINGTNEASFVANQLVVNAIQSNGTPANVKMASALLGNNSAGTNFLTLEPPNAMASSYTVTLPPPNASGVTAFLTYDTSNNIIVGASATGAAYLPGDIITSGSNTRAGALLCDGNSYLISTYPALAAALLDSGTGKYAYGAADGTHFNVPDFQGQFLRGTDPGGTNDPDFASRTVSNPNGNTGGHVGSEQLFATGTHAHFRNIATNNEEVFTIGGGASTIATAAGSNTISTPNVGGAISSGNSSTETRPVNIYVNYFIKT